MEVMSVDAHCSAAHVVFGLQAFKASAHHRTKITWIKWKAGQ